MPQVALGGHSVSGRPCPAHAYNRQGRDGTTSGDLGDLSFTRCAWNRRGHHRPLHPQATPAPTWPSQPLLCKEQAGAELKDLTAGSPMVGPHLPMTFSTSLPVVGSFQP